MVKPLKRDPAGNTEPKPPVYTLQKDRVGGVYWYTILKDGVPEGSNPSTNREMLLRRIDKLMAKSKIRKRPCMCCGKTFKSTGIRHRLCDNCRHDRGGMI